MDTNEFIQSYGYSAIQTQLHSVPPWAAAFAFSMLVATFSDYFRHRFLFALVPIAIAIAGFAILITTHHNTHLEYGALFMVTCGTYSAMPIIVCWFQMNLGGHHRRAVGSAWQIGFGNIGGIIAVCVDHADQCKQVLMDTDIFVPEKRSARISHRLLDMPWLHLPECDSLLYIPCQCHRSEPESRQESRRGHDRI